jgi:hypothetical protein
VNDAREISPRGVGRGRRDPGACAGRGPAGSGQLNPHSGKPAEAANLHLVVGHGDEATILQRSKGRARPGIVLAALPQG